MPAVRALVKMNEIMYYVTLLFSALQQLPHFRGKTHTPSARLPSSAPAHYTGFASCQTSPQVPIRSLAHSLPHSTWQPPFRSPGLLCLLIPGSRRICSIIPVSRLSLISSRALTTMDNLSYFSIYLIFCFCFCLPPAIKCKLHKGSDIDCIYGCIYPQGLRLCLAHSKCSRNIY